MIHKICEKCQTKEECVKYKCCMKESCPIDFRSEQVRAYPFLKESTS